MPQPYNRSLPPGVPGEDFIRREDACESIPTAVNHPGIQLFQRARQLFQPARQLFQPTSQLFQREIQWLRLEIQWL
jgi:hypothetical protein